MNDLNNPILLLFCHLVITRQTEPAPENIGPYIDSRALYISKIPSCSALMTTYWIPAETRGHAAKTLPKSEASSRKPSIVSRQQHDVRQQIAPLTCHSASMPPSTHCKRGLYKHLCGLGHFPRLLQTDSSYISAAYAWASRWVGLQH